MFKPDNVDKNPFSEASMVQEIETEGSSSDFEGRHMCPVCEKSYNYSASLGQHIRRKHAKDSKLTWSKYLICPLCNKELVSKTELEKHVFKDHNINVEKENITFSSENDFSLWKANIEKETKSLYVKISGSRRRGDTNFTYFYCHRSGHFSSRGKGKRSLKVIGSNKINGVCPAMIKLKETNSCFIVEHVKTHIGHENELGRMPLKNIIANKLSKNIPLTNILDDSLPSHSKTPSDSHSEKNPDLGSMQYQNNSLNGDVSEPIKDLVPMVVKTSMGNNVIIKSSVVPEVSVHRSNNVCQKKIFKKDYHLKDELIEIGLNTSLKINPEIIKVNKKQTPTGNTVLQFIMDQKLANHGSNLLPKIIKTTSLAKGSNQSRIDNSEQLLPEVNAPLEIPEKNSDGASEKEQIASLKLKIGTLTKKIEELENKCIVQERQLSYSFIKRLKTICKNAAKGDPCASYILEQAHMITSQIDVNSTRSSSTTISSIQEEMIIPNDANVEVNKVTQKSDSQVELSLFPLTVDGSNIEIQEIVLPSGEVVQCYASNLCYGTDVGNQYYIIPNVGDQSSGI